MHLLGHSPVNLSQDPLAQLHVCEQPAPYIPTGHAENFGQNQNTVANSKNNNVL